jgi:hypothetical protein
VEAREFVRCIRLVRGGTGAWFLTAWKQVCQVKKQGGLGVKNLAALNKCFWNCCIVFRTQVTQRGPNSREDHASTIDLGIKKNHLKVLVQVQHHLRGVLYAQWSCECAHQLWQWHCRTIPHVQTMQMQSDEVTTTSTIADVVPVLMMTTKRKRMTKIKSKLSSPFWRSFMKSNCRGEWLFFVCCPILHV